MDKIYTESTADIADGSLSIDHMTARDTDEEDDDDDDRDDEEGDEEEEETDLEDEDGYSE